MMNPKFPLSDITLLRVETTRKVANPLYDDGVWQISPQEFAMQVEGVGSFYACYGNMVEYAPAEGATKESVELYLNGSMFGAILHQRTILPLHGSSFVYNGKGILLCGDSGSGKSALTASFCLEGALFLTDDITPVVFDKGNSLILPLSDRIKLWDDTLIQLDHLKEKLSPISNQHKKYYLPMGRSRHRSHPLHAIFIITPGEVSAVELSVTKGIEAFTLLRNEVYRWQYLSAMPESEKHYLTQLLTIAYSAKVIRVRRPIEIPIAEMKEELKRFVEIKI